VQTATTNTPPAVKNASKPVPPAVKKLVEEKHGGDGGAAPPHPHLNPPDPSTEHHL